MAKATTTQGATKRAKTAKATAVKPKAPKAAAAKTTAAKSAKAKPKPPVTAKPKPPAISAAPQAIPASTAAAETISPAPRLVTSSAPVVTGPEMKKRDLLDRVVKRSGIKKRDAKPVVEAMLAVMGEAMAEGRELNLQPFGKLKTNRIKDTGNGRVLICRLRQGGGNDIDAKEPLAETDD